VKGSVLIKFCSERQFPLESQVLQFHGDLEQIFSIRPPTPLGGLVHLALALVCGTDLWHQTSDAFGLAGFLVFQK